MCAYMHISDEYVYTCTDVHGDIHVSLTPQMVKMISNYTNNSNFGGGTYSDNKITTTLH